MRWGSSPTGLCCQKMSSTPVDTISSGLHGCERQRHESCRNNSRGSRMLRGGDSRGLRGGGSGSSSSSRGRDDADEGLLHQLISSERGSGGGDGGVLGSDMACRSTNVTVLPQIGRAREGASLLNACPRFRRRESVYELQTHEVVRVRAGCASEEGAAAAAQVTGVVMARIDDRAAGAVANAGDTSGSSISSSSASLATRRTSRAAARHSRARERLTRGNLQQSGAGDAKAALQTGEVEGLRAAGAGIQRPRLATELARVVAIEQRGASGSAPRQQP